MTHRSAADRPHHARACGPRLGALAMKQQPNLRIICMSGYADGVIQIPDSYKTITFLQKPFSLSRLAQTVRHVLNDDPPYSASAKVGQMLAPAITLVRSHMGNQATTKDE